MITNNNTDIFFQPKVLKRSLNMVSGHSKRQRHRNMVIIITFFCLDFSI
jgi:hypothetical protein